MASHPSRYHAVAYRLPRLPRELVHEILDDLSLSKVLELICNHKIPYIDGCVASHIEIGKLLPHDTLVEVKEYFALHLKICSARRSNPHPRVSEVDHDAHTLLTAPKPVNFEVVIKAAILKDLRRYELFFPVLRHFATEALPDREFWDTSSAAGLSQLFEVIDAAEVKMNSVKSEQLKKMADLLEKYPNFLRTCCEKTQETRTNTKHRVDLLRERAKRMPHRQILENHFVARSLFAQKQFYLIPYDRTVRVFLKILHRYPPDSDNSMEEKEDTAKSKKTPRSPIPHHYPDYLKLPFVLEGFAHQYPRCDSESIDHLPRVIHTKYSCPRWNKQGGEAQPAFFVYGTHPNPKRMKKWDGLHPMAEKEFEWLEAFIAICKYMSEMHEDWTKGQTVAEYWRLHV